MIEFLGTYLLGYSQYLGLVNVYLFADFPKPPTSKQTRLSYAVICIIHLSNRRVKGTKSFLLITSCE